MLASNANLAATHGLTKHGQNTDKAQPRDGDFLRRLRTHLAGAVDWQVPEPDTRRVAGVAWDAATVTARVKRLVEHHVRLDLEPFLNTMRRRLDRDRGRNPRVSRRSAPDRADETCRARFGVRRKGGGRSRS